MRALVQTPVGHATLGKPGLTAVLAGSLALFSGFAPGRDCGHASQPALGEAFTLKPGESAQIRETDVRVQFAAVVEDSRCPKGEQCITAGNARVRLEVTERSAPASSVELNTARGPTEVEVNGFRVVLEGLAPYPISGRPKRDDDYVVTLTFHRL